MNNHHTAKQFPPLLFLSCIIAGIVACIISYFFTTTSIVAAATDAPSDDEIEQSMEEMDFSSLEAHDDLHELKKDLGVNLNYLDDNVEQRYLQKNSSSKKTSVDSKIIEERIKSRKKILGRNDDSDLDLVLEEGGESRDENEDGDEGEGKDEDKKASTQKRKKDLPKEGVVGIEEGEDVTAKSATDASAKVAINPTDTIDTGKEEKELLAIA
ncbi:MAG: hypothetical protein HQK53_15035, partial [Oligoflexia bacterium]|nr:hypothetical protein [Oligoflexia bacterium]